MCRIGSTELELVIGDITLLEVDAFIFYAQSNLELGSGFGSAISVRGGPSIKKELEDLEPRETGEAVATSGGNLNAKFIVHAVGPKFQEDEHRGETSDDHLQLASMCRRKGRKELWPFLLWELVSTEFPCLFAPK